MKLNIEIDLSDIFTEEDGQDVKTAIKEDIYYRVNTEVKESIKPKIDDIVTTAKKLAIEELSKIELHKLVKECVDNEQIQYGYGKDMMLTKDYIIKEFQSKNGYHDPAKIIEEKVDAYAKELRERYDLVFAAQVVNKLAGQGLLKDDELKKLIS